MCDICGGVDNPEYQQRLLANIKRFGWTVQFIEGDEGGRNPAYAYTLGLSLHGHPEFITFNCHPELAARELQPFAEAVFAGRQFAEGDDLTDLFTPRLLQMPDSMTHLYTANIMFRRPADPPIQALQIVWPTRTPWLESGR
ncbi:DUF4262 domain-containing protein [Kribbella sp. CA-293567]|uniref:DUF4262 domain-containing protein n=1 Tax=Kribbella sp. CA-293567 TaxID=3002436 RepID=UPI0022DE2BD9|nr:DUF4262 domain-containing protein [Kribbella sp. CA-293567]WBQ02478.1 DUF4262 domain-containing protein [Kribbella sp. CA-293567]